MAIFLVSAGLTGDASVTSEATTALALSAGLTGEASVHALATTLATAMLEGDSSVEASLTSRSEVQVRAVSATRVLVLFGSVMTNDSTLVDPTTYTLRQNDSTTIDVASVAAGPGLTYVTLTLVSSLTPYKLNQIEIPGALSLGGIPLAGLILPFQWQGATLHTRIQMQDFTGEVTSGILGDPRGLVFFSPSLDVPAPGSVVQVEDVSVCARPYDTYTIPQPIDPPALYTYNPTVNGPTASMLNGAVLWGAFPRLSDARTDVGLKVPDTATEAVDSHAIATLTEQWDPTYVSLLNSVAWKLFDNAGSPPLTFSTANNAGPIPGGSTTTVTLEP